MDVMLRMDGFRGGRGEDVEVEKLRTNEAFKLRFACDSLPI
jgi:hypothetical protein